jgi:hypothetical protein
MDSMITVYLGISNGKTIPVGRNIMSALQARKQATESGLCWTVPEVNKLNIVFLEGPDNKARVNSIGTPILTPEADLAPVRAGFAAMYAAQGAQPGDEACVRYSVHLTRDGMVTALREHNWFNGELDETADGSVLTFYDKDTALPLRSVL